MPTLYQIGEVCQRTGLTQRALHYYDEIRLLVPSERLNGGQRLYSAGDLERIERIKNLKQLLGLSLSEIKRMLDADFVHPSWELSMARKDARLMMEEAQRGQVSLAVLPAIAQWMDRLSPKKSRR